MTFDAITYLMAKLDTALKANQELWNKAHATQAEIDALKLRVGSLEAFLQVFLRWGRLLLPTLGLILAGLAALGPDQTAKIILAILQKT